MRNVRAAVVSAVAVVAPALVVVTAGCAGDFSAAEPLETINGIHYSAEVVLVPAGAVPLYQLVVTLKNTTSSHQTRTYPAICPVQWRVYRLADDQLVYDETTRACAAEPVGTIEIDGLAAKQLYSGVRSSIAILGDSIAPGTYGIRAIVNTEGTKKALIYAGTWTF